MANGHSRIIEWDDLRFPLAGRNIDVSSGRIDFDYYNGTVSFATNARYHLSETISFTAQLPHSWIEGSELRPHIHWLQQRSAVPNWLLGYKIYKKGSSSTALEADFTNHTLAIPDHNAFTYSADVLEQITSFSPISMTGCGISDIVHLCLWRDVANDSGLFSGAESSPIVEHVRELDCHIQLDSKGSLAEFTK